MDQKHIGDRLVGGFMSVIIIVLITMTGVETDWGKVILDLFQK